MPPTRSFVLRTVAAAFFAALFAIAQIAADPEPRWWRGNLHTHTLWSDGDGFPEMIAEWYRDHGYHFLALSDHNVLSQGERWMTAQSIDQRAGVDAVARYRKRFGEKWVETRGAEVRLKTLDEVRTLVEERNRFLMISSEEITGAAGDGRTLHMNATNLGEPLPFLMGSTVRESMVRNLQAVEDSAKRTGRPVMLHVNHPNYKWGVTAEDLAAVVNERFFEVWNGVDGDNDPGDATRPSTDAIWDIANALRLTRYNGAPLFGLGTDDSHNHHDNKTHSPPGRAWVMVRAAHLSPESIIRAMRNGDFYATTGVELESITFDKPARSLSLRIKPTQGVEYTTQFVGARKGATAGEVFAEQKGAAPSYRLRGNELFVRAVVKSNATPAVPSQEYPYQRAWTQPVGW